MDFARRTPYKPGMRHICTHTSTRPGMQSFTVTCLRVCACVTVLLCTAAARTETGIEQSYNDMYNLQFDDAHRALARYEAVRPHDPLGPVSDAAACLFSEFDRLHILQSEFFVNDHSVLNGEKQQPDPGIRARFDSDLEKTQRLANCE